MKQEHISNNNTLKKAVDFRSFGIGFFTAVPTDGRIFDRLLGASMSSSRRSFVKHEELARRAAEDAMATLRFFNGLVGRQLPDLVFMVIEMLRCKM